MLKNNQKLGESEKNALKNFVDEHITVSTNENKVGKDVSRMVVEVNKHRHTKTCRKYDTTCRFGYPRYPSLRTIIAEPISEDKQERLKQFEEIFKKVGNVLNDNDALNEIIAEIGASEQESIQ